MKRLVALVSVAALAALTACGSTADRDDLATRTSNGGLAPATSPTSTLANAAAGQTPDGTRAGATSGSSSGSSTARRSSSPGAPIPLASADAIPSKEHGHG